jgi:hypothetical protein
MAIKFSWKNEIPQIIKNIRDTLLSFLAGCLTFAPLFAPKLHITGEDYAMWIGFIMLAIGSLAKMVGISDEEKVLKNTITFGEAGPGGSTNPPPTGLPIKP